MNQEVREFIKEAGLSRSSVEQVATMLPADDLELDSWIGEAIAQNNSMAFHLIVFAALIRDRPVDARHLSHRSQAGGEFLSSWRDSASSSRERCPSTSLKDFATRRSITPLTRWVCSRLPSGATNTGAASIRIPLIPEALNLARRIKGVLEVDAFLLEIASRTGSAQLERLIREHYPKGLDAN